MIFLHPLNVPIPKIPFSFFAEFGVWVTSAGPGVSLSRILGGGSRAGQGIGLSQYPHMRFSSDAAGPDVPPYLLQHLLDMELQVLQTAICAIWHGVCSTRMAGSWTAGFWS